MKHGKWAALAATTLFAMPLAAYAAGDPSSRDDRGAEAMFKSLDKNQDGALSRDEVKGTPHDKDFGSLDRNRDGKLSREEPAAAPEHSGARSGAGTTSAPDGSSFGRSTY
jgi:hypothetical protein